MSGDESRIFLRKETSGGALDLRVRFIGEDNALENVRIVLHLLKKLWGETDVKQPPSWRVRMTVNIGRLSCEEEPSVFCSKARSMHYPHRATARLALQQGGRFNSGGDVRWMTKTDHVRRRLLTELSLTAIKQNEIAGRLVGGVHFWLRKCAFDLRRVCVNPNLNEMFFRTFASAFPYIFRLWATVCVIHSNDFHTGWHVILKNISGLK